MIAAAGPFTTSDDLEMEPLHDLLKIVKTERPNVLLLVGQCMTKLIGCCVCVCVCVCVCGGGGGGGEKIGGEGPRTNDTTH